MIETLYEQYLKNRTVTTDSRNITPGCIFFALKGDSFDGNTFAAQALEKGAALCVIDNPKYAVDERCMVVTDALSTLQELARYHRMQQNIPFIGITGTNGKTTTKELIHAVLSKRYRTHATQGNLNNHIGVPLTLLSMPADTEIAIIEMGASHPGEIELLCNIALPDFGLITNVGKAHLEGFGSFEGVVRTKTELYRHLSEHSGVIFVNADNNILLNEAEKISTIPEFPSVAPWYQPHPSVPDWQSAPAVSIVTYGSSEEAQMKGSYVNSNPYMKFYFEDEDNVYSIQSQLLGGYNFDNAMAAVCVGRYFDVDLFDIKEAIEQYAPANKRSQYKQTAHNVLYLDCYNANPSSMKVAIDNFEALKQDNKMVFLGSMKELGAESVKEHGALLTRLEDCHFAKILLVGEEFRKGNEKMLDNNSHILWFADSMAAKNHLTTHPVENATILLKGSNSTKMWLLEEVL